jgi:UDP-N-acetylmuramate--alanine ligase
VCADDYGASSLLPPLGGAVRTYGTSPGSMLRATEVMVASHGTRCTVVEEGHEVGRLELPKGGLHSLLNALAAAGVGRALEMPWAPILEGLAGFAGIARRFERLGAAAGVSVVDDYAHHPTEIRVTLEAVRAVFGGARLVAAFQPHLFSRTRDFATGFGEALAKADVIWVTDVFPAREAPIPGVTGGSIADAVRRAGAVDVRYHADLGSLPEALADALQPGDVLVTLGAGSIETVGRDVLERLGAHAHA